MKKYWIICLCIFGFLGCSGTDSANNAFLGTWRMENAGGRHTVMSLKNNGTFEIDIRIEGALTKIIDKKGGVSGTWEAGETEDRLVLNVTRADASIGWPEGEVAYRIGQRGKSHLVLILPDGREQHWKKSSHTPSEPAAEAEGPTVTLAPLVVSLMPSESEANRRYKWLCVAMDIQLSPGSTGQAIRPQWKDKVILLLSSKSYDEINTLDKLNGVTGEIRNLLNPYFEGAVDRVAFSRTIVTGRQEAVDAFCADLEP